MISKQKKNPIFIHGHRAKSSKSSGSSDEECYEFEDSIIRVKAPSFNKHSMAIKINDDTSAADVIAKFQWRRQNSQKEKDEIDTSQLRIDPSSKKEGKGMKFSLHEVGGNIVDRRLEACANIRAILNVNPHAQWMLKGSEKQ